ncbi:MAG: endonuclease Q family protein [Trichlorobacter sp.]|nr:endonuclease Q family protein [Trichlorobacter sp.]
MKSRFIADLHIHSPYSRATSPTSTLAGLAAWAGIKGVKVVATGDFTHPGWLQDMADALEPAEPGLFRLKHEILLKSPLPDHCLKDSQTRFMLSAEVSCIYKRHGAVRKVHNLLYLPDFASVDRVNAKLAAIGNLKSDGRPILGLDSHDLLEILLENAPDGFLVPAHIWTPWFSLFGSRSGFNRIEDCYGDLVEHIFALETGLSSDPDMNRMISALDRFALISNSDSHSPAKLAREANIFSTDLSFYGIRDAIRSNHRDHFNGTIEFFPEEGKYFANGHRNCQVCLVPVEPGSQPEICPACGKQLTIGVKQRVMELADRVQPYYPENAPAVFHLLSLAEILSEILKVGAASKKVMNAYSRLITEFDSELDLLLLRPVDEIKLVSPLLAEAVQRMRNSQVKRQPGFDGQYGVIRIFDDHELATSEKNRQNLFLI